MKEQLLNLLIQEKDYISGQALAGRLGVSRQAIWKGVRALNESGYRIESVSGKGYRLEEMPTYLNAASLRALLTTGRIGKNLTVLDSVGSTNDYLKQLGTDNCEDGTVVATREQTGGKGRLGRKWLSKRDENLAFSVLLRPQLAPHEVSGITPLVGLAMCKALRGLTGVDCMIKWPNDIIVGHKKLVGILTEMTAEFDAVEYIVTGIGVNVDQTVFPEEIAYKATSLLLETGRRFDKNKLLAGILGYLDEELYQNGMRLSQTAVDEYSAMCATVGKSVTFHRGTRRISGMAVGVESDGSLKVMLSDGSVCNVNAGEVTVQGIY